ncbi:MAG: gliding motility-associated C-terminal domain-containing protein, partial [Flavobacteriales bacterium]|nr:gliding motility-associated C-terminal domain-containing protein [Flavobacteriales bacterium]
TSCVDFYDPLQVVAFDDVTICEGSDVHLSAMTFGGNPNNNVTYSWDGGQGIGANYTTAPAGSFPNNLQIQVVASDGCSPDAVDFVTVDFYPNPVPYFTPDVSEICPGEELLFENLSVPGSFIACHWDFGDGNVSNDCELQQTVSYSEPGVYNIALSLFSQHGCVGTSTGSVTVHPNPVADFSTTSPGNLQDMNVGFQDQSIGNIDDWHWTLFDNVDNSIVLDTLNDNQFFFDYALFGSQDLYAMQDTGYYPVHLEVTTVHGCSADTLKHIKIDGIDFINIPNAFSPNGDARNDEFFPVALGIDPYDDYEFLIFNRWGDLIFRGDDLYETWKGSTTEMTDNEEAQQGVYVWTLQYRTLDGQLKNEMGHVTLLR